ncbi:hypothetical protein CVD28_04390 [Bacillus sp. M6-12]|uniref:discoidin domain-containing protein n=1 Tax=Bacillus sp. M6-12 TaxID=2054166 RepID=UPI000C776FEC|nr:discoidin domain-containing protein [Bacillus sp. M6-12]PLS19661.1 hypothetical protein CVD28_04390 [Bacillus sp. M6-12]
MKKKNIAFSLVTIIGTGTMALSTSIPAFAEETKVIGTFEATIIDVQIPAMTTFIYNPNTEEMIADNLNISSETNAPIYANIQDINVSEESIWKPELVSPTKYTDEQWNNLIQSKSQKEVALGLSPLSSSEWLYDLEQDNIWNVKTKIGTIKNHGEVNVKPILKAGTSFTTENLLTTNYVFEFGLEEGETGVKIQGMNGYALPEGTTATASSYYGGSVPSQATDGNLGTVWTVPGFSGWIQFNFPAPQTITGIQLASNASPSTNEVYTVYGLQNGEWKQISSPTTLYVSAGQPNILPEIPVTRGTYEGIKVDVNGGSSWVSINEITLIK